MMLAGFPSKLFAQVWKNCTTGSSVPTFKLFSALLRASERSTTARTRTTPNWRNSPRSSARWRVPVKFILRHRFLLAICVAALTPPIGRTEEPPRTGPQTEARFPPLKVPAGFKATLFACDPLIEYPSAIAAGPRPGAVFVAVDYLTGLGTEITRRDEVRLVEDTDGDGYADKATVFAK